MEAHGDRPDEHQGQHRGPEFRIAENVDAAVIMSLLCSHPPRVRGLSRRDAEAISSLTNRPIPLVSDGIPDHHFYFILLCPRERPGPR